MSELLEAELFCEVGPRTEFRNGMFHVTQQISEHKVIRRCFTPPVFMAAIVAALGAVEAYQATEPGCAVLPFKLRVAG